jgi:hypothetical protein
VTGLDVHSRGAAWRTLRSSSNHASSGLVRRFSEEMTIGDPARIRANFLVVVERLFQDAVDTVARQLRKRGESTGSCRV